MTNKVLNLTSKFSVKAIDDDSETITISGYANTTDKDRVGDVVLSEAWEKGGMVDYMKNPIVLAFHDHSKPIGTVTDYTITPKGLNVTAEISKAAGNVYNLVKQGILKTFSVGFRVKDADYEKETDLFVIKDLELHEISVVSVPANQNSVFSVAKSFTGSDAEYKEFQEEFTKETKNMTDKVTQDKSQDTQVVDSEKLIANAVAKAMADMEAKKAAEEAAIKAKEAADAETLKAAAVAGTSGAERLVQDLEARLAEKDASMNEALEGLRAELKDKADEIQSLHSSKMSFSDRGSRAVVNEKEIDEAVLLGKILGKKTEETDFAKAFIAKADIGAHVLPMTADWETEFSLRMNDDVRQKLVLEPMFRTIQMNASTMNLPINPEAGLGEWIDPANYRSTNDSSTGTAVDHTLTDTTMTVSKLAAKEYIGYEEEEDAIIPILPLIRDAVVRRMARSSDIALLRGTAGSVADPIKGIAQVAIGAAGAQVNTLSIGGADKVKASDLQTARRGLGVYGLNPSDVIYLVSHDAYYDLLEDPDFRTMDVVGTNATILKGQIGSVNGSPVVVSGEFEAKASGKTAVVAVNTSNFIVGNLRGMMMERDRDIINQKNVIVATRRMAFLDIISGKGASVLNWAA